MIRIRELDETIIIEQLKSILFTYNVYNFLVEEEMINDIILREQEGTKVAEYKVVNSKDYIVIYPQLLKLVERNGIEHGIEILLHEVGHAFLDWYGMSNLMEKGYEYGIDVFDTSSLPFGENNFHEAFAQMFSLIIENEYSVKKKYPKWWTLVYDILYKERMLT